MTTQSESLAVRDAAELLEYIELKGIIIYEIQGIRNNVKRDESGTDLAISVQESHDQTFVEPRFRMLVSDSHARYTVDVGTRYEMSRPIDLSKSVLKEFIERVAIMAAFPFIRESVATTAARMELGVPVLGLLRAGGFSLDEDDL
jgi:hypothetical protein